jgi:hypothetical protein
MAERQLARGRIGRKLVLRRNMRRRLSIASLLGEDTTSTVQSWDVERRGERQVYGIQGTYHALCVGSHSSVISCNPTTRQLLY